MRRIRYLSLLVLTIFLVSCDSSSSGEDDAVTLQDLVGSWKATSHVFTNASNPSQSVDVVGLGEELDITVLSNGGVRTWLTVGEVSDEWDASISISGNTLTSTPAEASREGGEYSVSVNGDTFTLTDNSSQFDFTLSGQTPVAAKEVIQFTRK